MNGTPVEIADWAGVAALMYDGYQGCTGTLIAPRVVLTAGHCVLEPTGVKRPPEVVRFGVSDVSKGSPQDVAVARAEAMSSGYDGFDIALLFLSGDAPVAPVPLARGCGAATQGGEVSLVAFGVTDKETSGVLNRVKLTVDTLACTDQALGCQAWGASGSYLLSTPGGMCGGDSGGPLFVVNEHGKFVAGVVSGPVQTEQSDNCMDWKRAMYPRPDTVIAWIEDELGDPLMQPTCEGNGGGTAPGPTPGAEPGGEPGGEEQGTAPGAASEEPAPATPHADGEVEPVEVGCSAGQGSSPSAALGFALLGLLWLGSRRRQIAQK